MALTPVSVTIQTALPRLHVKTTLPSVRVDPSRALADIGLKPIGQIAAESASKARIIGLEAIRQIAREGDRMARIETGENAVPAIAKEKGYREKQINIDSAPKHRVAVAVETGNVSVQLAPGKVQVDVAFESAKGRRLDVSV
ncbi:MAG: hypothetical protein H0Z37_11710 [Firmicutes bacterium]|nr:hypothetical protein [Bacillota bacterium]